MARRTRVREKGKVKERGKSKEEVRHSGPREPGERERRRTDFKNDENALKFISDNSDRIVQFELADEATDGKANGMWRHIQCYEMLYTNRYCI